MNGLPADVERIYQASMAYNECLSRISHNRMQERMGNIVHKIATFTGYKAIEESVRHGCTNDLPDNYLKEVGILESRDKKAIAGFMDERLELWKKLLL